MKIYLASISIKSHKFPSHEFNHTFYPILQIDYGSRGMKSTLRSLVPKGQPMVGLGGSILVSNNTDHPAWKIQKNSNIFLYQVVQCSKQPDVVKISIILLHPFSWRPKNLNLQAFYKTLWGVGPILRRRLDDIIIFQIQSLCTQTCISVVNLIRASFRLFQRTFLIRAPRRASLRFFCVLSSLKHPDVRLSLRLMFCRDLYFRPTRLLFLFIGIVTIFLYIPSISVVFEYEILYLSLLSLYIR